MLTMILFNDIHISRKLKKQRERWKATNKRKQREKV